jgi:CBS domain-containing protein
MHVKLILKNKGNAVETIRPDALISEVVDCLKSKRIGVLVVTKTGDDIVGIVSERDIVTGLAEQGASLLDQPVETIMTRQVKTCSPDDTITSVMEMMTDRRIRHVPVMRDGALAGIVSIGDAVKSRLQELENEATHLREYLSN